ncbi:hypothetical protein JCM17845_23270 [Iodidimonas gelatinilytica]|uniref:(2Fe-2S)-binding protein n=1 Tax=Iodidimonas gelatinilytica TaxID=1236966 RepID=A0A5A7N1X9_9PROT|nr:hypothetical protein JCM17845_23270 [Iodidimonas gelatinilytica]
MYVCICNGLTENRVRAAARETGERRCARSLYRHLAASRSAACAFLLQKALSLMMIGRPT